MLGVRQHLRLTRANVSIWVLDAHFHKEGFKWYLYMLVSKFAMMWNCDLFSVIDYIRLNIWIAFVKALCGKSIVIQTIGSRKGLEVIDIVSTQCPKTLKHRRKLFTWLLLHCECSSFRWLRERFVFAQSMPFVCKSWGKNNKVLFRSMCGVRPLQY